MVLCFSLAAGEDSGQPHERIAASFADASTGSGMTGYSGSSNLIRRSRELWTAPGSLEAVTSGKVGAHGIQEAASR